MFMGKTIHSTDSMFVSYQELYSLSDIVRDSADIKREFCRQVVSLMPACLIRSVLHLMFVCLQGNFIYFYRKSQQCSVINSMQAIYGGEYGKKVRSLSFYVRIFTGSYT